MVDPDEVCSICPNTRENHGDMNHEFNTEGQLIQKKKAPEPRAKAPEHRDDPKPRDGDPNSRAIATMLEVLAEKGIFEPRDIIRVLQGNG